MFGDLPDIPMVIILGILVTLMTQVTSNVATTTLLMPIVASMVSEVQIGLNSLWTDTFDDDHSLFDHTFVGIFAGGRAGKESLVSYAGGGVRCPECLHAASCNSSKRCGIHNWKNYRHGHGNFAQNDFALDKLSKKAGSQQRKFCSNFLGRARL